ncbi:hypothetical protein ACFP2T_13590 [Plantactinospora solaniradicis]|uniref:Uncharacterized protein n=1 Tax=Plantactinospora solaniradicis TaxID=1723736 RepID=A0ABW1K7K4_9ACTN
MTTILTRPSAAQTAADDELTAAITRYNGIQRAELEKETGLRWLGGMGTIFAAGTVRIRALFVDPVGRQWADACLAVESAYLRHPAHDYYADQPGASMEPAHDLWVMTQWRGMWNAILVPIDEICSRLDLPDPVPVALRGYARTWDTMPMVTDAEALAAAADGIGHLVGLTAHTTPDGQESNHCPKCASSKDRERFDDGKTLWALCDSCMVRWPIGAGTSGARVFDSQRLYLAQFADWSNWEESTTTGWVHDATGHAYCRGEAGYADDNGDGTALVAVPAEPMGTGHKCGNCGQRIGQTTTTERLTRSTDAF